MTLTFLGITFEDYTECYEGIWSQICESCVKEKQIPLYDLDPFGKGSDICGVEGCHQIADFYIDLK